MGVPRGSADFEESDELQRLRRRAYGPNADIAGDAAAQARLSELEAAQRRERAPVVDAAAALRAPVSERVPVPEPLTGSRHAATSVPQPVNGASAEHEADGGSVTELTPASVAIGSEYTIELVFRFDRLDGYAKIVDFNNATEDCGLYSSDGRMEFWPITAGFGAAVEADSNAHVVLTRDATDNVVAYVNGVRQLSFHDTGDIAVIDANDTLRLFSDDTVTANEDSGGAVSRIRLYDGPLSASDVAALAAELPITAPTLADVEPFLREEAAADRFSGAVLVTRNQPRASRSRCEHRAPDAE